MNEDFGDRMKLYENVESARRFMPLLPVCVRLDGRSFSKFTKGMKRPYDEKMSELMINTTKYMVEETNANIGYTQSDEISLVFYSDDFKSQIFFDGRIQKMTSTLAAMCSVYFNSKLPEYFLDKVKFMPTFDCRAWQVPSLVEAVNTILWREQDATKNSISMAARSYFSHKMLQDKNGSEMQEMLFSKGVNWNDYPTFFKRGTYIQRRKIVRKFTAGELDLLPEKHEARKNPDLKIERTEIRVLDLPPLSKVINRVEVIFEGIDPIIEKRLSD